MVVGDRDFLYIFNGYLRSIADLRVFGLVNLEIILIPCCFTAFIACHGGVD